MARLFINPGDNREFYSTWPSFGKELAHQWDEVRRNFALLNAVARASYIESETTRPLCDAALSGLEFGEFDFHNKYRIQFNKTNSTLNIQRNTSTQASPSWSSLLTFSSTQTTGAIKVSEFGAASTYSHSLFHTLRFDRNTGFYIIKDSSGQPVVVSDLKRQLDITNTTVATKIAGLAFRDGNNNFSSKAELNFSHLDFYLTEDSEGNPIANAQRRFKRRERNITIENPSSSENVSWFFTTKAIRAVRAVAVITGSTSVTINIMKGTDRTSGTSILNAATAITSTTTGTTLNITTSAGQSIAANSFIWVTTTALSGTPTSVHIILETEETSAP